MPKQILSDVPIGITTDITKNAPHIIKQIFTNTIKYNDNSIHILIEVKTISNGITKIELETDNLLKAVELYNKL